MQSKPHFHFGYVSWVQIFYPTLPTTLYITDDNGGEAGPKDGVFAFASQDFVLPHLRPALHDGENFVVPSLPLGPCESLPHLVKLYFLLICPQLLQLFSIKPVSLIKIYLKLQINLSHQIKLIFSKNWIILLKFLTKLYHKKTKTKNKTNKNLIIQNQWFNSI